jgi:hypothetical protein
MSNVPEPPLKPLTPRQKELLRLIQGLAPEARHTITVVCRGTEPWEVQEVIEHRKLGDGKSRDGIQ